MNVISCHETVNEFVNNGQGSVYPLGAGGVPSGGFNSIIDSSATSSIINSQATSIVNSAVSVSGIQPPGSNTFNFDLLQEVKANSGEGKPWDHKHLFSPQDLFIVNGEAQQRDYLGNVIWGSAMDNLGVPEWEAKAGAQAQSLWDYKRFDDPRDQAAIGFGYDWASSAGGGFVLYPNKPNTNMMRSVYAK